MSGLPHYHLLVHEQAPGATEERVLRQEWSTLGFSKFRLVHDERGASYAAKYLAKSTAARVRASKDYGNGFAVPLSDLISKSRVQQAGGAGEKVPRYSSIKSRVPPHG